MNCNFDVLLRITADMKYTYTVYTPAIIVIASETWPRYNNVKLLKYNPCNCLHYGTDAIVGNITFMAMKGNYMHSFRKVFLLCLVGLIWLDIG